MASLDKSVVVFDGTSYFVESWTYVCVDGEKIVYRGSYDRCDDKCEQMNDECKEKRRR